MYVLMGKNEIQVNMYIYDNTLTHIHTCVCVSLCVYVYIMCVSVCVLCKNIFMILKKEKRKKGQLCLLFFLF